MAESSGPWRKMQVRGLDNAMQWMGKDDARKKRRLERSVGVEWGTSEAASSKRWYHID